MGAAEAEPRRRALPAGRRAGVPAGAGRRLPAGAEGGRHRLRLGLDGSRASQGGRGTRRTGPGDGRRPGRRVGRGEARGSKRNWATCCSRSPTSPATWTSTRNARWRRRTGSSAAASRQWRRSSSPAATTERRNWNGCGSGRSAPTRAPGRSRGYCWFGSVGTSRISWIRIIRASSRTGSDPSSLSPNALRRFSVLTRILRFSRSPSGSV